MLLNLLSQISWQFHTVVQIFFVFLWIIRSIPTHFPGLNPGFKKKAFSL